MPKSSSSFTVKPAFESCLTGQLGSQTEVQGHTEQGKQPAASHPRAGNSLEPRGGPKTLAHCEKTTLGKMTTSRDMKPSSATPSGKGSPTDPLHLDWAHPTHTCPKGQAGG